MLRIASFNVNGVRARLQTTLDWLEKYQPDIVGLQETKVQDIDFPAEPFQDLGYHLLFFGQKSHYGVATFSKMQPVSSQKGLSQSADEQRRLIVAEFEVAGKKLHVINGYFPQGESRDHPTKFPYKMQFYDQVLELLNNKYSPSDSLLLLGDLNIAPQDADIGIGIKNQERWLKTGKCSFLPEERVKLKKLQDWGLFDSFRELNPDTDDRFSWFDYRSRGFNAEPKRGLRIDQIWITKPLMPNLQSTVIDYETRGGEHPSDHCPIWVDLKIV